MSQNLIGLSHRQLQCWQESEAYFPEIFGAKIFGYQYFKNSFVNQALFPKWLFFCHIVWQHFKF